jgi:hypothetical protein
VILFGKILVMLIGIVLGSFFIPILFMTIDILSRKKGNRLKSYHNEMKLLWSISRSKISNVFVDGKSGDVYYVTEDDKNNDFKMIVDKSFFDCYIVSQIHVNSLTTSTTTIPFGTVCSFKKYLLKKSRIRLAEFDINTFENTGDVYEKLDSVFKAKARDLKIKSLLS